jgi:hypothetical protein
LRYYGVERVARPAVGLLYYGVVPAVIAYYVLLPLLTSAVFPLLYYGFHPKPLSSLLYYIMSRLSTLSTSALGFGAS